MDIKKISVYSEKYGIIAVSVSRENKIGQGFLVSEKRNHTTICGYIDLEGKEIIPVEEMILKELFFTSDYQEICFGFELPYIKNLKYYHVTNNQDSTRVIFSTNPNDSKPLTISKIEKEDSLWYLEIKNTTELENKYALYHAREHRMITPFFADLELVEENDFSHFAYFYSNIYTTNEEEKELYFTSLCGFINQEGFFSSQILDTTSLELYPSYFLGDTPNSKRYQTYLKLLKEKYREKYQQEEEQTNQILDYLYHNPNLSWDTNKNREKLAKIIKFPLKEE